VRELDAVELQPLDRPQLRRLRRARLRRRRQQVAEAPQRDLGLAVDVDHVPHLLQRTEDEEGIDHQREELPDGHLVAEDEPEHEEEHPGAQRVDHGPLEEGEAADVAHLAQLQVEDPLRRPVQPVDLLPREAEALDDLDVAEALGGGAGERRGLRHDPFLDRLDPAAQGRAHDPEQGDGREVGRRDQPVHREGVDDDEDHSDDGGEEDVHRRADQLLDVGADLLQLAEGLAAALVLEDRVRQRQRVPDAVGIDPRSEPLDDDVDEVVLEVLRHAADERRSHGEQQEEADAARELLHRVFVGARRVAVDDVAKDRRIEQREDLVHRRQEQGQDGELPVAAKIAQQQPHEGPP